MSLATAVRIAGSSVRSSARRRAHPCGAARKSATTSIASVAEPPLPKASSVPPASSARRSSPPPRAISSRLLVERPCPQLGDLGGLHLAPRRDVLDDRVGVALAARRNG